MDFRGYLNCNHCNNILNDPIILSCCNKDVCREHIDEIIVKVSESNEFVCNYCHKVLTSRKFVVNERVRRIIHIFLDGNGDLTVKTNNLKDEIEKFQIMLKNGKNLIKNRCNLLKSRVESDRQHLKLQIDNFADSEIEKIESYENEMNENLNSNIDFNRFNSLIKEINTDLSNCYLGLVSVIEHMYCYLNLIDKISKVKNLKNEFERTLFLNRRMDLDYEPIKAIELIFRKFKVR